MLALLWLFSPLAHATDVTVVVVDSDMGLPIPAVEVRFKQGAHDLLRRSDANGEAAVHLPAAGTWTVRCSKDRFGMVEGELVVQEGHRVTVTIELG